MKYFMLFLLLGILFLAGCEVAEEKDTVDVDFVEIQPTCNDFILNQGEEGTDCGGPCIPCSIPVEDPLPPCENFVQDGDEEGIDCGGSCVQCNFPVGHENLFVINGDFEKENDFAFMDFDNYLKLGYVYSRNQIGPINGKIDMRIRVTQARKGALIRPSFSALLSEPLIPGKRYAAGFSVRDIKGSNSIHSVSLGELLFIDKISYTQDNYKVVRFTFTADVASSRLYFNFDGTRISEFRMDDIFIESLN